MKMTSMLQWYICLVLHAALPRFTTIVCADIEGCAASPLLPNKPFVVVWNQPTSLCEDQGIHLDFEKWGIVDNTRDRFFGQEIALLYTLGKWPYFNTQNQPINGGMPQLSDLQAHLTKVDNDLKTHVWNKTFAGLGVIDMEYWRPLYWTNFDSKAIYQRQSMALAKQHFPNYNQSQLLAEAIKEFNNAAREFMGQTLLKTRTRRPHGKWGYYLFPRCFDPTCNTTTIRNNDRINWLFQGSSGLYPSIYFKLATPSSSTSLRTKLTLHETFRVKAKYSAQNIPVMPYSKSQEGPYKMYQKMDLSLAVLQPADMGSSGVVIWGSSSDAKSKNECLILKDYINNLLGPYSRNVTNFFGNCSEQLCHSNGRCVRKDYERIYQQHLRESGRSNCLISDAMLSDEKLSQELNNPLPVKNLHNRSIDHVKERTVSNKPTTFLDYIKKFSVIFKWQNEYKDGFKPNDISVESSKSVVKFSIKTSRQKSVEENIDKDVKPGFAPNYDFDDYACKCFPGYSGNRCENSEI